MDDGFGNIISRRRPSPSGLSLGGLAADAVTVVRGARLVDTTMLYAPESGGVRRYLAAKRAWLAHHRPQVRHELLLPGPQEAHDGNGAWSAPAPSIPFGKGYRCPLSKVGWTEHLLRRRPTLIEAEDPYVPGLAALDAGQRLGVPTVGFCHTDLPGLVRLSFGVWAEEPIRRHWAGIYRRFDTVLAPSRHLAARLRDAGVDRARALPLGVDVDLFAPARARRSEVRVQLGLRDDEKLLIFAGRPAREKRIDLMVEAVEQLGSGYVLLLVGAGAAAPASDRVISLPHETDSRRLARLLASADAFVHANPREVLGLVVLEALACGTPVVGFASGGIGESVDAEVGELALQPTAKDLAAAIAALFQRDLEGVRIAARRRAVERHSWGRVFLELMDIYAEATGDASFSSTCPAGQPTRRFSAVAG